MWVSSQLGLLSNFTGINCLNATQVSGVKIKPVTICSKIPEPRVDVFDPKLWIIYLWSTLIN